MNKIIIQGRLTKDLEIVSGRTGVEYSRFSVAVDRPYKKGEEKQTDFFNCTAFTPTAAFIKEYFHKGDGIIIEGSMRSSEYEKNGEKRTAWEVIVFKAYFPIQNRNTSNTFQPLPDEEDGELPF